MVDCVREGEYRVGEKGRRRKSKKGAKSWERSGLVAGLFLCVRVCSCPRVCFPPMRFCACIRAAFIQHSPITTHSSCVSHHLSWNWACSQF